MSNEASEDVNGDRYSAIDGSEDDVRVETDEGLEVDNGATEDVDNIVRGAVHGVDGCVRLSDQRCIILISTKT